MPHDHIEAVQLRYQRILEAHPDLLKIGDQASRIEQANMRFPLKAAKLYRLADTLKARLEPFVVCTSGCSACCHMPTMAFQHEAEAMAVASGRTARRLAFREIPDALSAANAFIGQPCPFLVDGRCAIYAYRPLICRLHNSLNDDPRDCQITPTGTIRPVLGVDADMVEMPYIRATLRWNPREPYGTLQEFFSPG